MNDPRPREETTPRRPPLKPVLVGLAVIGALMWAWFMRRPPPDEVAPPIHVFGETMATTYSVKVVATETGDGAVSAAIQQAVDRELELINDTMSRYREGSEITRFNRHREPTPFAVSSETAEVLAAALRLSYLTGGAFDVTVGPLVRLWGFDEKRALATAPEPGQLARARERVGYQHLALDRAARTAIKRIPELDVDLSAIAKGFAVDRVAGALEQLGHTAYLVEVGGEVRGRGASHRGTPWRVAVERPTPGPREILRVIELSDRSMATSGDYRNFYDLAGRRVSHTIDPRTASPVEHRMASVTVVHGSCMLADGWATALNVLGMEEGLRLARENGLAVLLIERGENGDLVERSTPAFDALRARGATASTSQP